MTVWFPGACHLYLKFDPRCSSQYDYDKVSLNHTYFLSLVLNFGFVFYLILHKNVCVSLPLSLSLSPSFSLPFPFTLSLLFYYIIIIIIILLIYRSKCIQVAPPSKVAEYSGNTNGFGSHSVLGKGWPKELVKV